MARVPVYLRPDQWLVVEMCLSYAGEKVRNVGRDGGTFRFTADIAGESIAQIQDLVAVRSSARRLDNHIAIAKKE